MQLSDSTSSSVEPARLPAPAASIADGIATVTLEPHTAELREDTKAAIMAADRVRVFIDARSDAPFSKAMATPVTTADYPQETLAFLISHATLVCVMVLDCSKPDAAGDVEATQAIFDTRATENAPWVVRLYTDSPWDWGDFITKHRPVGAHCLASPIYEEESAG
jgi:hypothetical protein